MDFVLLPVGSPFYFHGDAADRSARKLTLMLNGRTLTITKVR